MKRTPLLFSKVLLLSQLLLLLSGKAVFAKAAFLSKADMVRSADIIALVDVLQVEPANVKGASWTYSEVATFKVERVLKGEISEEARSHGKENFICAQVRYQPGRHLLFLNDNGTFLTGANWHLGVRPITGQSVMWFENNKSIGLKPAQLGTVLKEIEEILANDWPVAVLIRHESRGPVTLKRALWKDGTVLFSDSTGRMQAGKVHHPVPWRFWNSLREADFFKVDREHYIVPDSDYETLIAKQGSEAKVHSWHGRLIRGFGGDIETDTEYRRFIEMWQKSVKAFAEVDPSKSTPVEEAAKNGQFRGYDVMKPADTSWLITREWQIPTEKTK